MDVTDSSFRSEVPEYERVEADMEPREQGDTGPQMHLDAHADGERSRDSNRQIELIQEADPQSARIASIGLQFIPV